MLLIQSDQMEQFSLSFPLPGSCFGGPPDTRTPKPVVREQRRINPLLRWGTLPGLPLMGCIIWISPIVVGVKLCFVCKKTNPPILISSSLSISSAHSSYLSASYSFLWKSGLAILGFYNRFPVSAQWRLLKAMLCVCVPLSLVVTIEQSLNYILNSGRSVFPGCTWIQRYEWCVWEEKEEDTHSLAWIERELCSCSVYA